jgi:hypothetical protein
MTFDPDTGLLRRLQAMRSRSAMDAVEDAASNVDVSTSIRSSGA